MLAPRLIGAIALGLICACSSGDRPVDHERAAQVASCAQALSESVPERGRAKLQTLIAGCSQVCPTLSRDTVIPALDSAGATPIIEACNGFCTDSARRAWTRAAPGQGYATLVRECGPESYGLTVDSGPLLSDTWLLLLRVHEWLEQQRRHADRDTRRLLEAAGMHAHFSLPLPPHLEGVYTLPKARRAEPMSKAFYAIAERSPEGPAVRVAAVPVARLRPTGLEQRPLPGGYFPGKVLSKPADDYQARYRMLEGMHPTAAHSTIDPTPAVLIDQGAEIRELLVVMRALKRPDVALAVAGHTAQLHPVVVRRLTQPDDSAPVVKQSPEGYTLVGQQTRAFNSDDHQHTQLTAALSDLARNATDPAIEVELLPSADMSALVSVMDLLGDAGFAHVLLRTDDRIGQRTPSQ